MRSILLAALALLPSIAIAQEAKVAITGPELARPGSWIILDFSESVANELRVTSEPQTVDGNPTIMPHPDPRKIYVTSRRGVWRITVVAVVVKSAEVKASEIEDAAQELVMNPTDLIELRDIVSADLSVDQQVWTVTVKEDGPNPGPNPEPGPSPHPNPEPNPPKPTPIPDGQFGIAKLSYDAAMKVDSTNRVAEAQALASGLEGVAASISAGVLSAAQDILSAILQANNAALGTAMTKWVGWGSEIGERIKELYLAGLIKSTDDWATLIREIATGLKAVK